MVELKLGMQGSQNKELSPRQKLSRTTKKDPIKPQSAVAGNRRSKAYQDENAPSLLESSVDEERLSIDDVSDGLKSPLDDMQDEEANNVENIKHETISIQD